MIIKSIKTRILMPPKDNLFAAIEKSIKKIPEKSIVAITSKIISIGEGRCVSIDSVADKDKLIIDEAEYYLLRRNVPGKWVMHTLKNNILIPTSGIDESNAMGHFILWPRNPKRTARVLYKWLRKKYKVKNLGVIITDSHSIPMRRGVVGISLASYGFEQLIDYRGKIDLFKKRLHFSQGNVADSLASAAVIAMGEGAEQTPIALIKNLSFVQFQEKQRTRIKKYSSFEVSPQEDLYYPFFKKQNWRRGGAKTKMRI